MFNIGGSSKKIKLAHDTPFVRKPTIDPGTGGKPHALVTPNFPSGSNCAIGGDYVQN